MTAAALVTGLGLALGACATDEERQPPVEGSLGTPAAPAMPAFLAPMGEGPDVDRTVDSGVSAQAGEEEFLPEDENDPLEGMNRYFFEVNYALDETIFKAVAGWYHIALPQEVQDSIRNALRNLRSPVILANDLFQGEFSRAGTTLGRFVVNSTAGIGGLFDVASSMGLAYHDEDFGQTLGAHGVGEGPYLVVPVLGPSNPRDLAGRVVDMFLDPVGYIAPAYGLADLEYVRSGLDAVDTRARNLDTLDDIRNTSLDYYATIRSLYRQARAAAIANTEGSLEAAPGIFVDEGEDAEEGAGTAPTETPPEVFMEEDADEAAPPPAEGTGEGSPEAAPQTMDEAAPQSNEEEPQPQAVPEDGGTSTGTGDALTSQLLPESD